MNNYDLHERAQELADTHSAYELARQIVLLREQFGMGSGRYYQTGPSTTACDDQFAADPNGGDHD